METYIGYRELCRRLKASTSNSINMILMNRNIKGQSI